MLSAFPREAGSQGMPHLHTHMWAWIKEHSWTKGGEKLVFTVCTSSTEHLPHSFPHPLAVTICLLPEKIPKWEAGAEDSPGGGIGVSGTCWVGCSRTGAPRCRRCPWGRRRARSHPCLCTGRPSPAAACRRRSGFVPGARARARTGFALGRSGQRGAGEIPQPGKRCQSQMCWSTRESVFRRVWEGLGVWEWQNMVPEHAVVFTGL